MAPNSPQVSPPSPAGPSSSREPPASDVPSSLFSSACSPSHFSLSSPSSSPFAASPPSAAFASARFGGSCVEDYWWREKSKAAATSLIVDRATSTDPSEESDFSYSLPASSVSAGFSHSSLLSFLSGLFVACTRAVFSGGRNPSGCLKPRAESSFSSPRRLFALQLLSLLLPVAFAPAWPGSSLLGFSPFAEAANYRFDTLEIAHRSPDLHHPLPYPFDATACSLASLRRLGERLRDTMKQKARHVWRRGEESSETLEKAMKTGVVIHKLERRLDMKRQVKVTVKATLVNHGSAPVENLTFLLPFHEAVQVGWLAASQGGKPVSFDAVSERPRISSFSPHSTSSLSHDALLVEEIDHVLQRAAGLAPDSLSGESGSARDPSGEEKREEGNDVCPPLLLNLKLRKRLEPQGKTYVEISYILGRAYRPVPRAVPLAAVQSVLFASTSAWPSPYPAPHGCSTAVALAPGVSFGTAGADRIIRTYGFEQEAPPDGPWVTRAPGPILPFAMSAPFVLHMPLPMHLGYFLSAERFVEVSHFGNIFFHEWFRLHNDAAKFEGSYDAITAAALQGIQPGAPRFSRFMKRDGVNEPREPPPSHLLSHLVAALPKRAFALEVFDKIGNISSTRAARVGPEASPIYTELELYPRFPLFGGWNTDFQIQYNLPARAVVVKHADAHRYTLNLTLAPPFRDIYTEDVFLNIALPSGAQNISVASPRRVEWEATETLHSWLDVFTSRPLLKLHFPSSFVPDRYILQHKVQVSYDYPPFLAVEIFKQLQICLLIFLVFLLAILLQRLRLRIASPSEKEEQETEDTALSVMHHLLEVFEEISQRSDDLIEAMRYLAASPSSLQQAKASDLLSQWKTRLDRASKAIDKNLDLLGKEQQDRFFPGLRHCFQVYGRDVEGLANCLRDQEADVRRVAIAQARADLVASELLQHIKHPERQRQAIVESADLSALRERREIKKEN
uniref:Dolichyl-diphosphooligosaccharide--protein glycosyltransferase subunit 1 n=1 Tax=Neospora caninum (strain Liverpool) TaxID=572307 RepID=A0A0F7UDL7_NEOCL|nr:TPA: Ribophorin I, related [Neospora caninum Liverpool]